MQLLLPSVVIDCERKKKLHPFSSWPDMLPGKGSSFRLPQYHLWNEVKLISLINCIFNATRQLSQEEAMSDSKLLPLQKTCLPNTLIFFFFFFDLGFTALSRIFHLYRADRSSKVGENRRTRRKTTWPSVSRTWLSHIWPERGSNHSGEKPNGLRVNSLIH